MTKRETYEQKTEQLLLPIMEEHQFELVDVDFVDAAVISPKDSGKGAK